MRLKQTIHDLTGLVSFSLAVVWRARSAVWRTVRVRRLRHDPRPPPPPVGNLRTGKCFWTFTHERQILFVLLYFCLSSHRHEASILRVLPFSDSPPVSHVRFLFPHIQKMFQSCFLVVTQLFLAPIKPESNLSQIKSRSFSKKTRHPVLMWNELKPQRNVYEEEEEATRPSDALRFTDCLSVTVSVSLPSSHHVLSLSLIITAASPRRLQWA